MRKTNQKLLILAMFTCVGCQPTLPPTNSLAQSASEPATGPVASPALSTTPSATDALQELYQQAKAAGETTAGTVSEWFQEDVRRMRSWRYRVVATPREATAEELEQQLNDLGRDGWECFAVQNDRLILKQRDRSYLQHVPAKDLLRLLPELLEGRSSP